MRRLSLIALLTLSLVLAPFGSFNVQGQGATTYYYVSTSGGGADPCSLAVPCSLTHAQSVVQTAIAGGMSSDIVVYLRGGTYTITEALAFTGADSGQNGHTVYWESYLGETAIISGGAEITGWTPTGGGIFQATVGTEWNFRQLYVDGTHAQRARGTLNPAGWSRTAGGYTAPDESMAAWGNKTDIEIVSFGAWVAERCKVAAIVGAAVTMQDPCWTSQTNQINVGYGIRTTPRYVENAYELMASGYWYLNRTTGILYYWPPGGTMAGLTVTAPAADQLLTVTGAGNIQFHDLTFAYSNWTASVGAAGYLGNSTGHPFSVYPTVMPAGLLDQPAAITVSGSQSVAFLQDEFSNLGSRAISIEGGGQDIQIARSRFDDNASGLIVVGSVFDCPDTQESNVSITDNYVSAGNAFEYPDIASLYVACAADTTVSRNEIASATSLALSVGFGWSAYSATPHTTIANNYVHGYCAYFEDCSAIYSNSPQSDTGSYESGLLVSGNYLSGSLYLAMYADDLSSWSTWTNNVTQGTTVWGQVSGTAHDVRMTDNYTTTALYWEVGTVNVTMAPNTLISSAAQPYGTAAQAIMCGAGVGYGVDPGANPGSRTPLYANCSPPKRISSWPVWGTVDASGLVGYWPLSEGAKTTAYNYLGGTRVGTLYGTPAGNAGYYNSGTPPTGKFNGSDDYVDFGNAAAPLLSSTDPWTVAIWVNLGTQISEAAIFTQWITGGGNGRLLFRTSAATPPFQAQLVLGDSGASPTRVLNTTGTFGENEWHFVAVSRSGATFKIYLDAGAADTLTDDDATRVILQTGNILGARTGGTETYTPPWSANYFVGSMRDLRVYNRALSDSEIQALYNSSK